MNLRVLIRDWLNKPTAAEAARAEALREALTASLSINLDDDFRIASPAFTVIGNTHSVDRADPAEVAAVCSQLAAAEAEALAAEIVARASEHDQRGDLRPDGSDRRTPDSGPDL